MRKRTVKFEKTGIYEYRTTDGKYVIKAEDYTKYRIYANGEKLGYMHTVNDAKRYVRDCVNAE